MSRSPAHTFTKPGAAAIELLAGLGVEGDAHAGVTVKHRSRVGATRRSRTCARCISSTPSCTTSCARPGFRASAGVMGENVTTRGVDLLGLPTGTLLRLGTEGAVVEVTGLRNPCVQLDGYAGGLMRAVLDRDADGGLVRKAGVMGVVRSGGAVRPGDAIGVELPAGPHQPLEPV